VGCGGSNSGSSTSSTGASARSTTKASKLSPEGSAKSAPQGSEQEGQGGAAETSKKEGHVVFENPGGDNSIQTYGSEAKAAEKDEIVTAMRSHLRAIAARDSGKVCADLNSSTRAQIKQLRALEGKGGGCTYVVSKILVHVSSEAKQAAAGKVVAVRVGKGNAFVLFRPRGGVPSYFLMSEEEGVWKANSINAGTPLSQTAAAGQ
jgi:hypothetical protein